MVRYLLVSNQPLRAKVTAACMVEQQAAGMWECIQAASIADAGRAASKTYCAVLLFECEAVTSDLRDQLVAFRKSAPASPYCAIVPTRKFDSEEISGLVAMGVSACIDIDTLENPARLHSMLRDSSSNLASTIVLGLLRSRLQVADMKAAEICVRSIANQSAAGLSPETRHSLLPEIRHCLPTARAGEAERFCATIQLLIALALMKLTQSPLSQVFVIAGLASEDAARKMLFEYTGITARDAHDEDAELQRAIHILLEIASGAREPNRRRTFPRRTSTSREQENRRTGEQENRRTGEQENRRTGEQENRRTGEQEGRINVTSLQDGSPYLRIRDQHQIKSGKPWDARNLNQDSPGYGGHSQLNSSYLEACRTTHSAGTPDTKATPDCGNTQARMSRRRWTCAA